MQYRFQSPQFFLLLLLIFWLPVPLGSNRPWAWAILEIWSFGLVMLWLLSSNWQQIKTRLAPYRFFLLALTIFTAWQGLQCIPLPQGLLAVLSNTSLHLQLQAASVEQPDVVNAWFTLSLDANQTLIMFVKSCAYLGLACLIFWHIDSLLKLRQLLAVMILAGLLQAVYGTYSLFTDPEFSWFFSTKTNENATGSFVYRNHFANFIVLTASLVLGWLLAMILKSARNSSRQRFFQQFLSGYVSGKFTLRLILACMVIALVLSHSRMGNSAFFISLTLTLCVCVFIYRKKNPALKRSIVILLFSVLAIDALILGSWFGIEKVKQRIENTSLVTESRDNVAIDSIDLVLDFPLTGAGAGAFYTVYPSVQQQGVNGFYDHAHNDYLQFVIEYGVPASALMAAIVWLSLWYGLQAALYRKRSFIQGVALGSGMAIFAMLIHISVDFNLQSPSNTVYFIIVLCIAWIVRFGLIPASNKQFITTQEPQKSTVGVNC
ncbi:O-antigen ligase family protein [Thalassotalea mangrovi]|uniref:O-antigen ligase family protein n=1 Tax=Thalassotalea mangrovi TaxID=2572245 RepID=A0A4U1B523_9GAMM|nr:O-antigen ligase family protein [Thalassotalea mangrovi]TKB44657.1 O-antigen ligase family protein [Thalassotalea mangrovi]